MENVKLLTDIHYFLIKIPCSRCFKAFKFYILYATVLSVNIVLYATEKTISVRNGATILVKNLYATEQSMNSLFLCV